MTGKALGGPYCCTYCCTYEVPLYQQLKAHGNNKSYTKNGEIKRKR